MKNEYFGLLQSKIFLNEKENGSLQENFVLNGLESESDQTFMNITENEKF